MRLEPLIRFKFAFHVGTGNALATIVNDAYLELFTVQIQMMLSFYAKMLAET